MGVAAFLCFLALCGVEKLFMESLLRGVCLYRIVIVAHRFLHVPLSAPRDGTSAPLQFGQSAECFDTRYRWLSSHAGNAWALVFVMAYFLRSRLIVGLLVFWAIAMCYSRMYLGVHYFSDLLGGFSLAFLGGGIMALVLRKRHIVCPTHQLQGVKVPLFVGGATFLILFVAAIFYRP